jgi:hypothetical protein
MSPALKPRFWLCIAAAAAAFWVTFRVLDADAASMPRLQDDGGGAYGEIPDPALDAMIQRFADEAAAARK